MILPHEGRAVTAGINDAALEYNHPLVKAEAAAPDWDFGELYLQAVKLSENGEYIVFRLSEQNGRRGCLNLPQTMAVMNMLEDVRR